MKSTFERMGGSYHQEAGYLLPDLEVPESPQMGIWCERHRRYLQTNKRARYHGFQSFRTGEVTPEEAHAIGRETARRMWGDEYQIVVTTHLNTENVHNHIVVNSVSFNTGRKFENHVSDHYKLREISDAICAARGKSVLKESNFYGGEKGAYWAYQKGQLTHRDILRRDVDEAIAHCATYNSFTRYLRNLGYEFRRDAYGNNPSVIAAGWSRAVRLKSLGPQYTPDAIHDRLLANHSKPELYCILYPQRKRTPLLEFELVYREAKRMDGLQLIFAIFLEMLKVCTGNNLAENKVLPLFPLLREEVRKLDQYIEDYKLLCDCHIDTAEELSAFRASTATKITELETQREQIRNRIRRAPKTEKNYLKEQAKALTSQITPLRKQLKIADRIMDRSVRMRQLLDQERQLETNEITKERNLER